jgi:hypothetical protein
LFILHRFNAVFSCSIQECKFYAVFHNAKRNEWLAKEVKEERFGKRLLGSVYARYDNKKAAFNAPSLYGGCANEKQLFYEKGVFLKV